MEQPIKRYECGGRDCFALPVSPAGGQPPALVCFPCGEEEFSLLPRIAGELEGSVRSGACRPFVLAGFLSGDWNGDFSPWPAPALFKKAGAFGGRGPATLAWMADSFLPETERLLGMDAPKRAVMGYSLAGLFALWSIFQTNLFHCCASCSGSLWYNGWPAYVRQNTPHPMERIFFSLGKKEEKARNPVMAAVGGNTRETCALLKEKLPAADIAFFYGEGGHFDHVAARITGALRWLMRP